MNQAPQFPTAVFGFMGTVFTIYILIMMTATITVLVALWRGMRAHEQIAVTLRELSARLGESGPERPSI